MINFFKKLFTKAPDGYSADDDNAAICRMYMIDYPKMLMSGTGKEYLPEGWLLKQANNGDVNTLYIDGEDIVMGFWEVDFMVHWYVQNKELKETVTSVLNKCYDRSIVDLQERENAQFNKINR